MLKLLYTIFVTLLVIGCSADRCCTQSIEININEYTYPVNQVVPEQFSLYGEWKFIGWDWINSARVKDMVKPQFSPYLKDGETQFVDSIRTGMIFDALPSSLGFMWAEIPFNIKARVEDLGEIYTERNNYFQAQFGTIVTIKDNLIINPLDTIYDLFILPQYEPAVDTLYTDDYDVWLGSDRWYSPEYDELIGLLGLWPELIGYALPALKVSCGKGNRINADFFDMKVHLFNENLIALERFSYYYYLERVENENDRNERWQDVGSGWQYGELNLESPTYLPIEASSNNESYVLLVLEDNTLANQIHISWYKGNNSRCSVSKNDWSNESVIYERRKPVRYGLAQLNEGINYYRIMKPNMKEGLSSIMWKVYDRKPELLDIWDKTTIYTKRMEKARFEVLTISPGDFVEVVERQSDGWWQVGYYNDGEVIKGWIKK